jgi:hypothetical protein
LGRNYQQPIARGPINGLMLAHQPNLLSLVVGLKKESLLRPAKTPMLTTLKAKGGIEANRCLNEIRRIIV